MMRCAMGVVVALAVGGMACFARAAEPIPMGERGEIERVLREKMLEVWFPRAIDAEHGGFLCNFDWQWRATGPHRKGLVFQARMTWLAAKAAERYPNDPRYRKAADHGLAYLADVMWDREQGGWYHLLDRAGGWLPEVGGDKHAYSLAFGIYACAAHHKATRDPKSLALAKRAFAWLDGHAHDGQFGGYREFLARDGTPIEVATKPSTRPVRDLIGTRVGYKSMNAHLHLLEALVALYEVWPDETVGARAKEVLALFQNRIIVPPGAMHQYFHRDWTPVPDHDSYGHDVEAAYLMLEAAHVLGMRTDGRVPVIAKSLVDHALEYSWDAEAGGFRETGGTFGPVYDKHKGWWTQAEGLNALLVMARMEPKDPHEYRALFSKQWAYMKANLIDMENGGTYAAGLDAGGDRRGPKAQEWKAGYHDGRALLNAVEWLGEEEKGR